MCFFQHVPLQRLLDREAGQEAEVTGPSDRQWSALAGVQRDQSQGTYCETLQRLLHTCMYMMNGNIAVVACANINCS